MEIMKEIQTRIENENRPSETLYQEIKGLGLQMFMTNTLNKEQVIIFCSDLVKLYLNLKK